MDRKTKKKAKMLYICVRVYIKHSYIQLECAQVCVCVAARIIRININITFLWFIQFIQGLCKKKILDFKPRDC